MRVGYAFLGIGLAVVKWPLLIDVSSLPVTEGVVTCLLAALSLLALFGLRHPVLMLPMLLFEVAWKTIWLSTVAAPRLTAGELDPVAGEVAVNCSLVIVIVAVVPWRYVSRRYLRTPADAWR